VALGVLAVACKGDDAQSNDGSSDSSSSAGPSSDPTIDPTISGPDTSGSASSSSEGSSSGGDESTTGGMPSGHARFIVRERLGIEGAELIDPVIREYDAGTLSDPVALVPQLPAGGGVSTISVDGDGAQVVYCTIQPPDPGWSCQLRDLTVDPPGPEQPFAGADLPSPLATLVPEWIPSAERYFFHAALAPDGGQYSLMRAAYEGGVLGECEALVALPDGDYLPLNESHVSPDGITVAYVAGPGPGVGPFNAYVLALDAVLPAMPTAVSDLADPAMGARSIGFLNGANAAIYGVGGPSPIDPNEGYYLVDLAAPAPPGVRIDDPAAPAIERRGLLAAPDDHALVYWIGDELFGDLHFVELDGLVPQLAITVNAAGTEVSKKDYGWSPDSRWLMYVARLDGSDTTDLYLVDAAGASPSAPIVATNTLPGGAVDQATFDAASHWLYFVGQLDSDIPEIFRVDISGDTPGEPQKVSAPIAEGGTTGEMSFSHDGSMLLYSALEGADHAFGIWLVDIGGELPGAAVRIDGTPEPGFEPAYGARFSPDDTLVTYHEHAVGRPTTSPLRLVDLSAPQTAITVSDDAFGVLWLPD
jgi:hypothetical protein